MRAESLSTVWVESAPPGVLDQRKEALAFFTDADIDADINVQANRPPRDEIIHHDPFDGARIIAWRTENSGYLSAWDLWHLNVQRAAHTIESMGGFDTQVDIRLVGRDLVSYDERETRTRNRAVLAAFALEQTDEGFGFYVGRTLYEKRHKAKEHEMMLDRDVPVGAAMVMVSPCQPGAYGRSLGMFPEREMAVLQISWKKAQDVMSLRCVSLDRASLTILRQMLAERGVHVPEDAEPEDYLAFTAPEYFRSQAELDTYVEEFITCFDQLVAQDNPGLAGVPRQGIVGRDARNSHSSIETITETPHGQLALSQIHKLDVLLSAHAIEPSPMDNQLRELALVCADGVRSDGSPLLRPFESEAIKSMLNEEKVYLEDPAHGGVLKLIVEVHNSAIQESLRDFMAGDRSAMDWMKSSRLSKGPIAEAVGKGIVAIEQGRGASGCGSGGDIEGGLPDPKLLPDAYMMAKYGRHAVEWGSCGGCGKWRLVARCAPPQLCGTCDHKMSSRRRR